jgi:hypothetical protein
MSRTLAVIIAAGVALSLITSALIVRDGLLAIATQVREKPIPKWPEQLHIVAGDSKVNLDIAKLSVEQGVSTAEVKITIDNMRVTTPKTQESR